MNVNLNEAIEHILYAIHELESSIIYLTTDKNDPQYQINQDISREIKVLYTIIEDIIDKVIIKDE